MAESLGLLLSEGSQSAPTLLLEPKTAKICLPPFENALAERKIFRAKDMCLRGSVHQCCGAKGFIVHQLYRDLVEARAAGMVAAAASVSNVTHNGFKGTLREIVVRDLIVPVLPPAFIAGTGQIIDAWGGTSGQTDIVIVDRRVVPPVLLDQSNGIFPVEAVIATIEIKSKLNSTELIAGHKAAEAISKFVHAPPVGQRTHPPSHTIEHVIPYLLAFETDLTVDGKTELARYQALHAPHDPSIRGLCVVGRGFWSFGSAKWHDSTCAGGQGEVVGFVASLVNLCQRVAQTRLQPSMLDYLENTFPSPAGVSLTPN